MHVLLESRAAAPRGRGRWTVFSAAAHVTLITAAIVATSQTGPLTVERFRPDSLIYVTPAPARPRTPSPAVRSRMAGITARPAIAIPDVAVPGPVDLSRTNIDRRVVADISGPPASPGASSGSTDGVFTELAVERVAAPRRDNPAPAYPRQLRYTGLQGTVVVRFVVDTSGAVEPGSVAVLEATHVAFADAVRAWLPRTRYHPAEVAGRRVRQLVQQRIEFQLH